MFMRMGNSSGGTQEKVIGKEMALNVAGRLAGTAVHGKAGSLVCPV